VLRAAVDSGADALHPGYGPLAESAGFAEAVLDAGLTWIGPPPAVIRRLGDKLSARRMAQQAGAPVLPAGTTPLSGAAAALAFARESGLPIAIKAVHGGGGAGVAVARSLGDVPRAYAQAMRNAAAQGGQPACFAEQHLDQARHLEIQCLADRYGHVAVISTRGLLGPASPPEDR
jgi:acetyl-CoA/propionyl-CoA carboxylase biotin carboxyl carrier protein